MTKFWTEEVWSFSWHISDAQAGSDNTVSGMTIQHDKQKIITIKVPRVRTVTQRFLASVQPDRTYSSSSTVTSSSGGGFSVGKYAFLKEDGKPIGIDARKTVSSQGLLTKIDMVFSSYSCGGYYSPLMLFFGDKWPAFRGIQNRIVLGSSPVSYWPEKGAPGYFLALDKNRDGQITEKGRVVWRRKGKV